MVRLTVGDIGRSELTELVVVDRSQVECNGRHSFERTNVLGLSDEGPTIIDRRQFEQVWNSRDV
jgi:hypothetical protein